MAANDGGNSSLAWPWCTSGRALQPFVLRGNVQHIWQKKERPPPVYSSTTDLVAKRSGNFTCASVPNDANEGHHATSRCSLAIGDIGFLLLQTRTPSLMCHLSTADRIGRTLASMKASSLERPQIIVADKRRPTARSHPNHPHHVSSPLLETPEPVSRRKLRAISTISNIRTQQHSPESAPARPRDDR